MNRRTGYVTVGALIGVLAAGSVAVAANIGILTAADQSPLGDLPATVVAAGPATTVEPTVVDVYVETPTSPTANTTVETSTTTIAPTATVDDGVQEFVVADAGTIEVGAVGDGLQVVAVDAADGWTWTTEQTSPTSLDVRLVLGDVTYVFHAELAPDGSIVASVEQPIVEIVQAPPAATPTPGTVATAPGGNAGARDDDGDSDVYDDDHGSDDDRSDDDRSGNDDDHEDDDHDYDGADDDD